MPVGGDAATEPEKATPTRGRPRVDGLEDRILDATLAILARDGYARLSIDAVAQDAGTTRPTIYRRFADKETLAVASIKHLRGVMERPLSGNLEADFRTELEAFRDRVSQPFAVAMVGTVLAEENANPRLLELYRERIVKARRERLRKILDLAVESGEIDGSLQSRFDDVVEMAVGSYYAHYLNAGTPSADWAERIAKLALAPLRS
jgi:AcrR family transcriptional regulator